MVTRTQLPIVLDRLLAGLVIAIADFPPTIALAAIAVGGALALAATRDEQIAGIARRAISAALGGLSALGLAHALAVTVTPLAAGG